MSSWHLRSILVDGGLVLIDVYTDSDRLSLCQIDCHPTTARLPPDDHPTITRLPHSANDVKAEWAEAQFQRPPTRIRETWRSFRGRLTHFSLPSRDPGRTPEIQNDPFVGWYLFIVVCGGYRILIIDPENKRSEDHNLLEHGINVSTLMFTSHPCLVQWILSAS